MAPETISDSAFQEVMNYRLDASKEASDRIEKVVDGLAGRMRNLEIRVYGCALSGVGAGWYFFGG